MKKVLYLLLIPIMVLGLFAMDSMNILSGEASANDMANEEGNIVTVNGLGTVKVKPDIAYINIGVQVFNTDAKEAQDENAKLMDAVVNAIKRNGVKDEDIKTIGYNIYKSTKYEPVVLGEKENRIEGYYARNTVEVTVRDIDNVGKIVDAAGNAGANEINRIRFGISDEEKYYNEALKLAMKNASGKAQAILSTFGAKIDKPYRIIENSYGAATYYRENAMFKTSMADDAAYNTPVETGELEITARLAVEYKY